MFVSTFTSECRDSFFPLYKISLMATLIFALWDTWCLKQFLCNDIFILCIILPPSTLFIFAMNNGWFGVLLFLTFFCMCFFNFFNLFSQILRHDKIDDKTGAVSSVQVQVRNIKLGISTFWSLEKFECKLAAMKELYEVSNTLSKIRFC